MSPSLNAKVTTYYKLCTPRFILASLASLLLRNLLLSDICFHSGVALFAALLMLVDRAFLLGSVT